MEEGITRWPDFHSLLVKSVVGATSCFSIAIPLTELSNLMNPGTMKMLLHSMIGI